MSKRVLEDTITDVEGITVGHADDAVALTGCTVVLCGDGAVVGVDVRGLAPGTRETDLCRPGTMVEQAQAVLLSGGSAFGLEAAGGVMRFLWERGLGFQNGITPVPIVPAAVLFDLGIGAIAWPDADMGYRACLAATDRPVARGCIGAGTGATVGKILGPENACKSGIGTASVRVGTVTVGALVAVNALGDVILPREQRIIAGARDPATGRFVDSTSVLTGAPAPVGNTTLGVVATDARLSPDQAHNLAVIAHDGLARAIRPVHTPADGDTVFSLATGRTEPAEPLVLGAAAVEVVERAIVDAVLSATPAGGLPSAGSLTE